MKSQQISASDIKVILSRFVSRFHILAYTLVVVLGMLFMIYTVYQIIIGAIDQTTTSQTQPTLDTSTIKALQQLDQSSSKNAPITFPADQRINPFVD